jgi:hypothetical protein
MKSAVDDLVVKFVFQALVVHHSDFRILDRGELMTVSQIGVTGIHFVIAIIVGSSQKMMFGGGRKVLRRHAVMVARRLKLFFNVLGLKFSGAIGTGIQRGFVCHGVLPKWLAATICRYASIPRCNETLMTHSLAISGIGKCALTSVHSLQ